MPELPDLQVFSRNLDKKLRGKKLARLKIVNKKKLKVPEAKMRKAIEKASIKKIYREGKEIHMAFDNGTILGLHLMLKGQLHLSQEAPPKYSIIEMYFDDGLVLAMTDYQGAATPTLNPEERPAPDALSKRLNYAFLKELLSKKRTPVKTFLLDQKMIRGIGNAYADEILWDARISPFAICQKIPDAKIKALVRSIPAVLKDAEKQIRKKDPDTISGEIRDFLKIHNSKKEKSPTGKKIHSTMLNSRITYYTDEQQDYK
jgi:formamidopyrimidine-DNA glycosylase